MLGLIGGGAIGFWMLSVVVDGIVDVIDNFIVTPVGAGGEGRIAV